MMVVADVILVGGGLANGLIADRLAHLRGDLDLVVLEQGEAPGGNHTWSFHESDVSAAQHAWLAPYVAHRWPRQEVRFAGMSRILETGYCSIPSVHFAAVLARTLGSRVRTGVRVASVAREHVVLADGEKLSARCVIDGRGLREEPALALGFQKFVGREIETQGPHGRQWPVIMDATVSQEDGYRFVYTLPLAADRLLIEDTYYADGAELDEGRVSARIDAYAASQGWQIAREIRREAGVLPIVLSGNIDALVARDAGVPRVGLRGGLFHPTTGYSLPDAVRVAELIATLPEVTPAAVADAVTAYAREAWRRRGFFRMLNRMLFVGAAGTERASVLERFYGLPEPLIQRFYAADLTTLDQMRILSGKPPIGLGAALRSLPAASGWAFVRDRGRAS